MVQVGRVGVHAVTEQRAIDHIIESLDRGMGGAVVTPNLDHLRRYERDPSFAAVVDEFDLVLADGMPLVWASRLAGRPLPQRVAGSDLILTLSLAAAQRGKSIFLLGGAPGTADGAGRVLRDRAPTLRVAGAACPAPGFEFSAPELARLRGIVSQARPDIVFVALGSPKQERLIDILRATLPSAWWLGVGVSFSFLTGDVARAPMWMRNSGLEWAHRLCQEPRRLVRRYLIDGIPFAGSLMARSALARLGGKQPGPRRASPAQHRPGRSSLIRSAVGIAVSPRGSPGRRTALSAWAVSRPALVDRDTAVRRLGALRGVILLGGSVRGSPLRQALDVSLYDLPVRKDESVLQRWAMQADDLRIRAGIDRITVRLLLDRKSPSPQTALPQAGGTRLAVERDGVEFRGTGGLVRDASEPHHDDDLLLIATAGQIMAGSLTEAAVEMARRSADVCVMSAGANAPSGLMLVRCGALRQIPTVGFIDLKEQALPLLRDRFDVRVCGPAGGPVFALRTLDHYIAALRCIAAATPAAPGDGVDGIVTPGGHRSAAAAEPDPYTAAWNSCFAIIEPGAHVAPGARLHDAVVLSGAAVEADAVLARCVIGPGVTIKTGRKVVDSVVSRQQRRGRRGGL